jgi:suppressor of ftsI
MRSGAMASDGTRLHRRAFLASASSACQAVAATRFLAGPGLLAPAAVLLPRRAHAGAASGPLLVQPSELRSRDGVLDATLTAAPAPVQVGEFTFPGLLYNGAYLPPLLRVRTGDVMRIKLRNRLAENPTNLHFHGMGVSPKANSDNVFIHVHPGEDFQYEVRIPARDRQGRGLFWYHPHAHGFVEKQIVGGLSGGIAVDGMDRYFPILKDLPEKFLFIKHHEHMETEIFSINGQINPVVAMRPGEVQFWRIGHIGATEFVKFAIDGMPLYVLATDGHPLSRPQRVTEFFLGPGQRLDTIAIGPPAGEHALRTIPFQNQAWNPLTPAEQIATVVSSGTQASAQPGETAIMGQRVQEVRWIDEVRKTPIARRRTLTYSRTHDRKAFMINSQVMDENRIDQTVKLGDTEEWTIVNTDRQYHSFHIHQTPFLVTELNGVPQNEDSMRDTFSTPPAAQVGFGSLKVVIPFTDPVTVGKFVYHCHSVDHEDKGMMGVIELVA